jgi:uncharacterized membrane protein (TIGR02234 family)
VSEPPAPTASGSPRRGLDGAGPRTPRRELAIVVLACAVGAALVLFAASRTWSVTLTVRPAPLPPLRQAQTGSGQSPWLPAVALVALAGAGALLAVRGLARTAVGALLVGCGAVLALGAVGALTAGRPGGAAAGDVGPRAGWPLLALSGAVLVAVAGLLTVVRGRRWPGMGARYERRPRPATRPAPAGSPDAAPVALWEALDRGDDPTAGP